jgi:Transposase domain (DUF772)
MMVAAALRLLRGVPSSRKIERKTHEDVAFRVIAGGGHPDHSRISDFRRVHLEALAGLFVEILRLCQKAGLVKLGSVALDGTKVRIGGARERGEHLSLLGRDLLLHFLEDLFAGVPANRVSTGARRVEKEPLLRHPPPHLVVARHAVL